MSPLMPDSIHLPVSDREIHDLLNRRELDRASALIQQRFTEDPDSPENHYFQGVLHYFRGKIPSAIEHLKKTLELHPQHTDAAICLSVLLNDLGRYDEAKRIFEQANQSVVHKRPGNDLEIDRKFSIKHLELADLYFRYRRYDEAIDEYAKAAALNPTDLDVRIRHAKACAKKGYLSRALQELQQLKIEHPTFYPARIQLGLLHYSQGNVLDAELEWETVLELDPQHREAKSYLEMARQNRATRTLPPLTAPQSRPPTR